MRPEPVRLHLLPLPGGGTLDQEAAVRWLREDYAYGWHVIGSFIGTEAESVETRRAVFHLFSDVRAVIEACADVFAGGPPARFEHEVGLDEPDCTRALAILVASRPILAASGTGPFEDSFDELAAELARRLGAGIGIAVQAEVA